MWVYLSILAGVALIFYFKKRNAVWGGLVVGIIIGIILTIINLITNNPIELIVLGKIVVIAILAGFILELLNKIFKSEN